MNSLKLFKLQIVLFGTVFIFSQCSSEPSIKQDPSIVSPTQELLSSADVEESSNDIVLNDGEKWVVDAGMNQGVKNIADAMSKFEGEDLVDFQLLGDFVGDQTSNIISSCTMKGQGHIELHKWLLPFLSLKDALMMATSVEEGKALMVKIKAEIEVYKTYFKFE